MSRVVWWRSGSWTRIAFNCKKTKDKKLYLIIVLMRKKIKLEIVLKKLCLESYGFNFTPHRFNNFLADKPCTDCKAWNQRWLNWITLLNELSRKILEGGENLLKKTSFVSHAEQNVTRQNERQKENPSTNCIELVSGDGKAGQLRRRTSIGNLFPSAIHFLINEPSSISAPLCRTVMTGNFRTY